MYRQGLNHWDYEDDDEYDHLDQYGYQNQYDYQDQYDCQDQYNSYSNNNYQPNSYRNGGGRYQPSSKGSNGKGRKSNAGRNNNQQTVSRQGQQSPALNDEPTVSHIGYLLEVPSSSSAVPSKSTISKMAPPGRNIVVNVININHNY